MLPAPDHDRWFREQVQVHHGALLTWVRTKFPSIGDPDNLIQETFARVCRLHVSGTEVASLRGLLFTTAHNLAVDQLRRQKIIRLETVPEIAFLSVYEERPSPDEESARAQELELLTEAIQSLPERCRRVLTLRKIYRRSQKEIAVELGISEHTVERQVLIGMRKCTEFFARYGLP